MRNLKSFGALAALSGLAAGIAGMGMFSGSALGGVHATTAREPREWQIRRAMSRRNTPEIIAWNASVTTRQVRRSRALGRA